MGNEEGKVTYALQTSLTDTKLVKTYEGPITHKDHGTVRCIIHRTVRNDNGVAYGKALAQLESNEPFVGFWEGDVIQYFDDNGNLIDERR